MPATPDTVVGSWKLKSCVREILDTHEKDEPLGAHPYGRLIYTQGGHVAGLLVHEERPRPMGSTATDDEAVTLFRSMISYTGRYRVEGDKILHVVEASWNGSWAGTVLTRIFKIAGPTLTLTTHPAPSPTDGRMGVGVLVWERDE